MPTPPSLSNEQHHPDISDLVNDVHCNTTFLKALSTTQDLKDLTKLSLFSAQPSHDHAVVCPRQHQFSDLPISQTPQCHPLKILSDHQFGHGQHGVDKPAGIFVRRHKSDAVKVRTSSYPSLLGQE